MSFFDKYKNLLTQELIKKIVIFSVVGVTTAIVYVVLTHMLVRIFDLNYLVAGSISYPVGVMVSYVGQAYFTFNAKIKDPFQITRFIFSNVVGYILAMGIIYYAPELLNISELLATLIVVALLPVINFFVYLLWVFSHRDKRTA
jgi:putative flippase GtrA